MRGSRAREIILYLSLSIAFAVMAAAIWFVFLRPVPTASGYGTIVNKVYKPPGEYTQVHAGARDAFFLPTTIPIAEGFVVEIKLDDEAGTISSLLNAIEAEHYSVGTRVQVEYSLRSLPPVWQKCYVHSVSAVDVPSSEL